MQFRQCARVADFIDVFFTLLIRSDLSRQAFGVYLLILEPIRKIPARRLAPAMRDFEDTLISPRPEARPGVFVQTGERSFASTCEHYPAFALACNAFDSTGLRIDRSIRACHCQSGMLSDSENHLLRTVAFVTHEIVDGLIQSNGG